MPIHKAVLDTNVMVSMAFAKEGLARKLRDMMAAGLFAMATSKAILRELYEVLHYPNIQKNFSVTEDDINEFIGLLIEHAIITKGRYQIQKIEDDPDDDKFLACALEAKAGFIVSRDPHLRDLKHFQGIQIVDVRSFIEAVEGK